MGGTESALSDPSSGPALGPEFEPWIGDSFGPVFFGVPVLASDATVLVVIATELDGRRCVWRGQPDALERVGELALALQPAALVHHVDRWHLFGTGNDGRARHCTSDDLVSWQDDPRFADEHPNLTVRGAAATSAGVVLLGEVIVQDRRMGWTLLDDTAGSFRAREVTFPLTAAHELIGPVHVGSDELALVLASGTTTMLARSTAPAGSERRGRSWTLCVLSADMTAIAAVGAHGTTWIAGSEPSGGRPMLVRAGGRPFHLPHSSGGAACAAVMHRDVIVMARSVVAGSVVAGSAAPPTTEPSAAGGVPVSSQSRPAYIDSISAL